MLKFTQLTEKGSKPRTCEPQSGPLATQRAVSLFGMDEQEMMEPFPMKVFGAFKKTTSSLMLDNIELRLVQRDENCSGYHLEKSVSLNGFWPACKRIISPAQYPGGV